LNSPKIGCQLPQDTNIDRIFELARDCEKLGYDSLWVYDHLTPYWLSSQSSLEAWTLLSAVASHTSTIRIGTLVTNVNFRNPALLAKMAATVDNISDGRLIVGLGIGDRMSVNELKSYGYRFPPIEERMERLRETVRILKELWSGNAASLRGQFYNLSNAICRPKPKQETGPPLWIGGRHPKLVEAAAELADGWNYWGLPTGKVLELEKLFYEKCAQLNRSIHDITESWAGILELKANSNMPEQIRAQVASQVGEKTVYFIASFPPGSNRKAYEAFTEAITTLPRSTAL
jgi:alkanesulfonate monooxygenase SsuD/methylene tetrahydromethanopterin reductase-like flavin-dependent oxidoreductase (luciferase family)